MPGQPPPPGFATRAMTEVRNPIYRYDMSDDFKLSLGGVVPPNVLEAPPVPKGGDPRLTSAGTTPPVAGLPQYVPMAYKTPYNVWQLFPA